MTQKLPKSVLITGATGALGSALARRYAGLGAVLILVGRDEKKLENLAEQCRDVGVRVVSLVCDLADRSRLLQLVAETAEKEQPDLVIANAGVSNTADQSGEAWEAIEEVVSINLLALMATVQAVVPTMRANRRGQIALVSSLAAWYGLPVTPAYAATKAAIKNYGEALRIGLSSSGIKVNVIMPGFVASDMSRTVPGAKPFLLSPTQAAKIICKGLAVDNQRISFPFPLNLGCWLLGVLPVAVSGWLMQKAGYRP